MDETWQKMGIPLKNYNNMKRIKTFKIFENESTFNVEEAMNKIRDEYTEMDVANILDEETTGGGWIDDDWEEEGYDSEYDWYMDYGRGEAEDVVVDSIIDWYESKNGRIELGSEIRDEYGIRNF